MAKKAQGRLVNRAELAEILGISLPTVNAWVKDKMPVVRVGTRGVEWQFDTAAVIQWRADLAAESAGGALEDIETIEKETARVKLERERLKYAHEAALVVPLDQLERRLAVVFAEVRTSLRNIPKRTASILVGETNERVFTATLLEEIDRTLTALSEFNTSTLDDSLDADQPNGAE